MPRLPSARSSRSSSIASSIWPCLASIASARSAALTGCGERKSSASIVCARSFTGSPPLSRGLPHDLDRPQRLALLPGRLAPSVELEQGEEGYRLGEAVLAADLLVEVDAALAGERRAQPLESLLQRDGRSDVSDVDLGRRGQEVAEGGAELLGVIDGGRGIDGDPAQLRRQRRRTVQVAALRLEALNQLVRRGAVAAILEQSGEQLLDRLLRPHLLEPLVG